MDFAVDKKGNLLIHDFDISLIRVAANKKEEIFLSRQEAHNNEQLSINNILIFNVANFPKLEIKRKNIKKTSKKRVLRKKS